MEAGYVRSLSPVFPKVEVEKPYLFTLTTVLILSKTQLTETVRHIDKQTFFGYFWKVVYFDSEMVFDGLFTGNTNRSLLN